MSLSLLSDLSRERPVLIAGPTASGKSALALELAARDGRMIVNADALQVYSAWRIISARPPAEEEALADHRLYGHVARDEPWSVGHWLRAVTQLCDRPLVIVGGTGLYFMALTEGLAEIPPVPPEVRAEADALRHTDLAAMIAGLDPGTAAKTDLANPARVQRAWEVLRSTGRGLSDWQKATPAPLLARGDCEAVVFRPEPDWLNARIDRRFDQMMAAGALEEARAQLPFWQADRPWARAIGAPELIAHLQGEISLSEATEAAKLASRQYAKRQRSWLRGRMADWRSINPAEL